MLVPVVLLSVRASEERELAAKKVIGNSRNWDCPRRVLCGSNNRGAGTNDRSGRAFHYLGGSRAQPASVDLKLALDQRLAPSTKPCCRNSSKKSLNTGVLRGLKERKPIRYRRPPCCAHPAEYVSKLAAQATRIARRDRIPEVFNMLIDTSSATDEQCPLEHDTII